MPHTSKNYEEIHKNENQQKMRVSYALTSQSLTNSKTLWLDFWEAERVEPAPVEGRGGQYFIFVHDTYKIIFVISITLTNIFFNTCSVFL